MFSKTKSFLAFYNDIWKILKEILSEITELSMVAEIESS